MVITSYNIIYKIGANLATMETTAVDTKLYHVHQWQVSVMLTGQNTIVYWVWRELLIPAMLLYWKRLYRALPLFVLPL